MAAANPRRAPVRKTSRPSGGPAKPSRAGKAAVKAKDNKPPFADPDFDPINAVIGASADVDQILEFRWSTPPVEPYLSNHTAGVLRLAAQYARTTSGRGKGRMLVRPEHLLWAQLATALFGSGSRFGTALRQSDSSLHFFAKLLGKEDRATFSKLYPRSRNGPADAVIHWGCVEILAKASELRRRTNQEFRDIGQRHLVAALFATKPGQTALRNAGAFSPNYEALRSAVIRALKIKDFIDFGDQETAWNQLVGEWRSAPQLADRIERRPDYLNDRVRVGSEVGPEPLGAADDARALADLILLEAAEPPIAVGLFGPWGSGKSTLLEYLKAEVRAQTRAERERPQSRVEGDKSKRIVTNVVQLSFNAWTFADSGNLWATFTSEVFDQLANESAGAAEEDKGRLDESLDPQARASLRDLLKDMESQRSRHEATLVSDKEAIETRRSEVLKAEGKLADAQKSQRAALPKALEAVAKDVKHPGIREIPAEYKIGFTAFLRYSARLAKAGYENKWAAAVLVATAAICALALWKVPWGRLPDWTPWTAGLAAMIAAATPALKVFLGLLGRWEKNRLDAAKAIVEAQGERDKALAGLTAAEKEKAKHERLLEKQGTDFSASTASSRQMLDYLLEDSALVAAVRSKTGVLAAVRRCFEQLDMTIAQSRSEAAKLQAGDGRGGSVDRIILYIDDLDRCTTRQVSDILQVVHLLLSFRCFVVIVAADAHWLKQSLEQEHPQLFAEGASGLSSADYLEKIFQIPFWVRPLVDADADTQAARYRPYENYIDHLLRDEQAAATDDSGETATKPKGRRAGGSKSVSFSRETPTLKEDPTAPHRERIVLTPEEKQFIKKLGPLAAKSPRAVKRLVNTYRLMRVRIDPGELTAFLGAGTASIVSYRPLLFALACEVGLPPTTMTAVAAALSAMDEAQWKKLPAAIEARRIQAKLAAGSSSGKTQSASTVPSDLLIIALECAKRLEDFELALKEAELTMGKRQLDIALDEVRRYSFRIL